MAEIELYEVNGKDQGNPRQRKIRGGLLLGVGCVTSPCCTPLLVPLALTLLAGTPIAAFLTRYVGWVYALLTLISLGTLFLGVRHLWPLVSARSERPAGSDHPTPSGAPRSAVKANAGERRSPPLHS